MSIECTTRDAPPFDPTKPSTPVSYPLTTLDELKSRVYLDSFHYMYNKSSVPLTTNVSAMEKRPRILVCHDMQGGYIDDKWVQGGTNQDAYAIWHWYVVDVFVYFSHNLVTLPPPCWTNTAHRHGVKVLGTFILEWDEGRAKANVLLATKESAQMYAERLAELAASLGFDGWLINVEVTLDKTQIPNLKEFITHLKLTMNSLVPGSLVIWYDAVTVDGDLSYQNQLNASNKPFFDISDGILVNYQWQENYPKQSADVAGDRNYDVYMGIDAFGRGTFGGGQWNTNVALDVLKKTDISACLFAPGWVKETNQPPDFQTAQNHWWSLVEKSWGVTNVYPKSLPFYSNFDLGHGYHISIEGEQVQGAPWNNISSQGFQPVLDFVSDPDPNTIQFVVNLMGDSYNGGGNIRFEGTLKNSNYFTTRVFQGQLLLSEAPLYLTHSVKSDGDSLIGLSLQFTSSTNGKTSLLIASSHEINHLSHKFNRVVVPRRINEINIAPGWVIQESSIDMNGYTLTDIFAVCYKPTRPKSDKYFAVLGHITLRDSKANPNFPSANDWLIEAKYIKWSSGSKSSKTLSLQLTWKMKTGKQSPFQKFNIYVENEAKQTYVGSAYVEAFYISELSIPSNTTSIKFIVQACSIYGYCQNLNDSPYFQLNVAGLFQIGGTKSSSDTFKVELNNYQIKWSEECPIKTGILCNRGSNTVTSRHQILHVVEHKLLQLLFLVMMACLIFTWFSL